eukprot:260336-Rhodomonas_salina.1
MGPGGDVASVFSHLVEALHLLALSHELPHCPHAPCTAPISTSAHVVWYGDAQSSTVFSMEAHAQRSTVFALALGSSTRREQYCLVYSATLKPTGRTELSRVGC